MFDGARHHRDRRRNSIDRGIFYIPQESSLFNYMSVENNLRLPLEHLARRADGLRSRNRRRIRRHAREISGAQGEARAPRPATSPAASRRWWNSPRPIWCVPTMPDRRAEHRSCAQGRRGGLSVDQSVRGRAMAILLVDHNVRRVVKMSQLYLRPQSGRDHRARESPRISQAICMSR